MSEKHLGPGSVEPPRVPGLLRVYSMHFCPFAQRARLVVKAKNLPHDIVNINLQDKPDWYLKIHPKGQVPALLDGEKIVIESLDIADYLDEKYPEKNPLYPSDSAAKQKDKDVIGNLVAAAAMAMSKFSHSKESYSPEEALNMLLPPVELLEKELVSRGTKYFGGDKPRMIDYMLWPFAERAAVIPLKLGQKLPLKDDQIPTLRKWAKAMREDPTVKEVLISPERHYKILQQKLNGELVEYEKI
uniref:Glutathione S-transferase o2 n=1 Tax=Lissorhoptrus oryzophilus TaxID=308863 RepID=A0A2R4FXF2_9CUCU|nr:glutathione S-transferase o2 [Lissorhoptrus oryzophilus]